VVNFKIVTHKKHKHMKPNRHSVVQDTGSW